MHSLALAIISLISTSEVHFEVPLIDEIVRDIFNRYSYQRQANKTGSKDDICGFSVLCFVLAYRVFTAFRRQRISIIAKGFPKRKMWLTAEPIYYIPSLCATIQL
jgi:hypothetical protein